MNKKKIALIYSYSESWIGGTYYILNFIQALKKVENKLKPEIYLFCQTEEEFRKVLKETNYPFLHFQKKQQLTRLGRFVNRGSRFLLKRNFFTIPNLGKLDMLFPVPLYQRLPSHLKYIFWIPDFQEHYLPEFFSEREIKARKRNHKYIAKNAHILVVSSQSAKQDFQKFYPKSKAKIVVLPFAVTHPQLDEFSFETIKQKYGISEDYFFITNQFWAHKNHKVVLQALKTLAEKDIKPYVVMTGSPSDYRNKDNFDNILNYIKSNNLTHQVNILGFIPRQEQLLLLKNCKAVIQPSLFEGWSTVVEDAKVYNKFVIASELDVHKEQLKQNVVFFDPKNEKQLAGILEHYEKHQPKIKTRNYQDNIRAYGQNILNLIQIATA